MKIFEKIRRFFLNGVEVLKNHAKCDTSCQALVPDLKNTKEQQKRDLKHTCSGENDPKNFRTMITDRLHKKVR